MSLIVYRVYRDAPPGQAWFADETAACSHGETVSGTVERVRLAHFTKPLTLMLLNQSAD